MCVKLCEIVWNTGPEGRFLRPSSYICIYLCLFSLFNGGFTPFYSCGGLSFVCNMPGYTENSLLFSQKRSKKALPSAILGLINTGRPEGLPILMGEGPHTPLTLRGCKCLQCLYGPAVPVSGGFAPCTPIFWKEKQICMRVFTA